MSYSTLQAIWPGEKHENIREFPNSHGTAPIVWGEFCKRYLGKSEYGWLCANNDDLWACWKRKDIPESHRAVLMLTFDRFYVLKKDYRRFAADLRKFLDDTLISANHVNHWPLIAQAFEMEPDYPALALWCTSVTRDLFVGPYDEEKDEYGPFDWSTAFDLYAEMDGLSEKVA